MFPDKVIAAVYRGRPDADSTIEALERWAEMHHVRPWVLDREDPLPIEPDEGTLAVSLGGDGTFLRMAQRVAAHDTPVLGVNLGSLGFLTQTSSDRLTGALDAILEGKFSIEERLRLEAEHQGVRVSALNEMVLSRADVDGFTEIDLFWEGEFISRYPGDGLIVSTPSGSTAYSLAAYGPLIAPQHQCITVTPLNVHGVALRPLVLPAEARLVAEVRRPGWLIVDGTRATRFEPGDQVSIRRSPQPTRIIVPVERPGFFRLLAEKLRWGYGHPAP